VTKQRPITKKISDLGVITHLTVCGIQPVDRSEENGRASLYYEETAEFTDVIGKYALTCSTCGLAPIEFFRALADARRMLLDGELR